MLIFFFWGKKSSFLIYQNSFFFFPTINASDLNNPFKKKNIDNFCTSHKKISKIKDQHVMIFRVLMSFRQASIMEDIEKEKEKEKEL